MAKQNHSRRVLGDIGNLVGALSNTCIVTKPQQKLQETEQEDEVDIRNINRPITRKYQAELTRKQMQTRSAEDHGGGKSKLRRISIPIEKKFKENSKTEGEDVHLEIVKENIQGKNLEPDDPEEIEMFEAEISLPSIDEPDVKNPLAVVEYVTDIYDFYLKAEKKSYVPPNYMSNQTDINHRMRAILIDWIIEVHHKLGLMHETLFLAINLIDRHLSCQHVAKNSLQLVGITGMLIACKYEEIYVPRLDSFVFISAGSYSRQDILKMEKEMLTTLQFNLSVPTPYVFMKRFLKAANSDTKLYLLSFYLVELCMLEYTMLRFPPSLLSASAIYTARGILKRSPLWTKTLGHHSTYSEAQLLDCVKLIEELQKKSGQGRLTAVYRKHSSNKYGFVSNIAAIHQEQHH